MMRDDILTSEDLFLFHQGTNYHAYRMLGAHLGNENWQNGVRFSVWAPEAARVFVVGEWNDWRASMDSELQRVGHSGVWSVFMPEFTTDYTYKYEIHTPGGVVLHKADPYAFWSELRPGTASIVTDLDGYHWQDGDWCERSQHEAGQPRPLNIYEVHLGSWVRHEDRNYYSYRELAENLSHYASSMGYTHIELLPIGEHPLDESWGYQTTGYYAATSRFGHPRDFMYFVDCCHQRGLGVILDWTPGQFCRDIHGLLDFDGSHLYEYPDAWRADNHEWGTASFDHGKPEVQSFLISNAMFWIEYYHIDGLRLDAVSNMLYLNYNRRPGEWTPNSNGGTENWETLAFICKLNEILHSYYPQILTIAEDATMRPKVTAPVFCGGLGFDYKWNIGWMKDTLTYIQLDPLLRGGSHALLTYAQSYAKLENYILPLAHDEVVHGKLSLLSKQYGDYWSQFANMRTMFSYTMTMPGAKLLFMGGEFGQFIEWCFYNGLDWHLLQYEPHWRLRECARELNFIYRNNACLWDMGGAAGGFDWLIEYDVAHSTLAYKRTAIDGSHLVVLINFTPIIRYGYSVPVHEGSQYQEIFNSDDSKYGGSGVMNKHTMQASRIDNYDDYRVTLDLPPLAAVILRQA